MYCCPGCLVTIENREELFKHLDECNQDDAKTILTGEDDPHGKSHYELVSEECNKEEA